MVEVDLLAEHGFALDQPLYPFFPGQGQDIFSRFLSVLSPENLSAVGNDLFFQLGEVEGKIFDGMPFYLPGVGAEVLPVFNFGNGGIPGTEASDKCVVKVFLKLLVRKVLPLYLV